MNYCLSSYCFILISFVTANGKPCMYAPLPYPPDNCNWKFQYGPDGCAISWNLVCNSTSGNTNINRIALCNRNQTYLNRRICEGRCQAGGSAVNRMCTAKLKPAGCYCKGRYVRNSQNQCVLPKDCNSNTADRRECGDNEEHKDCGSSCEPTCANPSPQICNRMCLVGVCQCRDGFVRNEEKKCVLTNQCRGGSTSTGCADGKPPVNCFADPCQVTKCNAYPNASCRADYCGGCNARFFDSTGSEVTAKCNQGSSATCAGGQRVVNCLVNPCQNKRCPAFPRASCVVNNCGGCNFKFINSNGDDVTKRC